MRKVLSIIFIFGLSLGVYNIFSNFFGFISSFSDNVIFIQDTAYKLLGIQSNQDYTYPTYNNPFDQTYVVEDSPNYYYFGDGYGLLTEILKNNIGYYERHFVGAYNKKVVPDFSSDQLKDAIKMYSRTLLLFPASPTYMEGAVKYDTYYYSIIFKDEIENAYLKAFEGQLIYIRSGSIGEGHTDYCILSSNGSEITDIKTGVFGGKYRFIYDGYQLSPGGFLSTDIKFERDTFYPGYYS